ncbi:MAG: 3-oxoacyl-[acyl-carrier-protein] reductase [Candidatus Omnitrophica bacterium CG1_02_49_10]|nr:MAG: 3-oxoacyl-[acyl-carrier-protein] reductase [Candidatus Omnitrophica bacterium CG1_02_49_10]
MLLKDKVALVTGGARGIGREVALLLAREGCDVAICDLGGDALIKTRSEIEALGRRSLDVTCDVSNSSQVDDIVNKTLDKFNKIDILINNAGITKDGLIVRMKESDWDAVIAVNLKGTFNCLKSVSKVMMKQRSGRIVNIASIIGLMGNVGQGNYAASKAGVIGLTKSAAKELAPRGVTVNAVAPGFIKTHMTEVLPDNIKNEMLKVIPLARFGEAVDVAGAVLFLVSEYSGYITGQVLQVDGGMLM